MVLKELIFKNFYYGRVWWFERTDFSQFPPFGRCGGLETLIFNSFYVGRVWWS